MTEQEIRKVFSSFKDKKVLLIGDAMIDQYIWGESNRISPEAPVPVVKINKQEIRLGGAANCALNIKSLGANPILCTVIGNDINGIENVNTWIEKPVPNVYSQDLSEFVMACGVKLLKEFKPDLMYLSTTDYIQHKYPPGHEIANKFYKSISMNPIMVKKELPGYLADRLQEALWREALHIINEGYATTKDLDRAIEDGPGLRWSLMGTFLTFHLAGGKAGMKHMLKPVSYTHLTLPTKA